MTETTLKIEHARFAITVDAQRRIIKDATVLVRGDRIVAVDRAVELAEVPADRVIDASQMTVTPGLVNAHDHLYPQVMRGMFADTMVGVPYIRDSCALRLAMSDEEQYLGTLSSLTEFLMYGTTTICNPGDAERIDPSLRAYEQTGARVIVGSCVTDEPDISHTPVMETSAAIAHLERTIDEYDGRCDGRVSAWAMLSYALGACSRELAVAAKRIADERGVGLTFHQSARQGQVDHTLEKYGMRPIQYLESIGVVGPNVLLGHAVVLDDDEISIMAATGTKAAMCPAASLRLGFGTTQLGRLPELIDAGVTVGFGTDSTDFSVADLMRTTFLQATLYKDGRMDTSLIPAETAFELATMGGARALGLQDEIGSIEVGKKADLVLFDTARPEWSPLLNPMNSLVYNADGRSVHTVIVDGHVRVEDSRPTFVDERALAGRLQEASEALIARTGVQVAAPRWPVVA